MFPHCNIKSMYFEVILLYSKTQEPWNKSYYAPPANTTHLTLCLLNAFLFIRYYGNRINHTSAARGTTLLIQFMRHCVPCWLNVTAQMCSYYVYSQQKNTTRVQRLFSRLTSGHYIVNPLNMTALEFTYITLLIVAKWIVKCNVLLKHFV